MPLSQTPPGARALFWLLVACALPLTPALADDPWPFERPAAATLRASPRKVFAHYFTPFPLSLDNLSADAPDRYDRDYLNPAGLASDRFPQGRYHDTGGYLRERPLPTTPKPAGVDYELVNLEHEVQTAAAAGLDGFVLDVLGYGPRAGMWPRSRKLMQAAANQGGDFKIVLMPDMDSATFKAEADPEGENLTHAVAELAAFPSVYRHDGRLVVAPYNASKRSADWWRDWIRRYETAHHERVFFVPLFQNWPAYAAAFLPFSDGLSDWGAREPSATAGNNAPRWVEFASRVHALKPGMVCMAPVSPQDFRPKDDPRAALGARFWEAQGSRNFRTMWRNAIEGRADWVQLITWNDYGECTEIAPSTGIQYAFYDLTAYYTAWFKTGREPRITRDAITYFHRRHHTRAPYAPVQPVAFRLAGDTPVTDEIELLAFVAGPSAAELRIEVGGKTYATTVQPGLRSFTAPLPATGRATPVFSIVRDGKPAVTLSSAFEINNEIEWQDFLYRAGGSNRPPVVPRAGAAATVASPAPDRR